MSRGGDPYPGGNLFSLASGGAIFVGDPHGKLGEDQLNGGEFVPFEARHWELIRPLLEENERLFGIPVARLLQVDGTTAPPERVYRAIVPAGHEAPQPEEAYRTVRLEANGRTLVRRYQRSLRRSRTSSRRSRRSSAGHWPRSTARVPS